MKEIPLLAKMMLAGLVDAARFPKFNEASGNWRTSSSPTRDQIGPKVAKTFCAQKRADDRD